MPEQFDRCLCSGRSFDEIVREAKRMKTTSIKRLKRELDMGLYCSACTPFVKEALQTGQTVFEQDPMQV